MGGTGMAVPPVPLGDAASTDVADVDVRIKKPLTGREAGASNG